MRVLLLKHDFDLCAMKDIIQARDLGPGRSHDPQQAAQLSSELKVKLDTFLLDEDRAMITNISGHSYESLEGGVLALPSCDLEKVLSNVRFLMHDLNTKGLTMLRHILAERMYKARQEASGATDHPDFETFQRDGFLLKDLGTLSDEEVLVLLRMVRFYCFVPFYAVFVQFLYRCMLFLC